MIIIGFSTSVVHKTNMGCVSKENIDLFKKSGCSAIEIGCVKLERIEHLPEIYDEDFSCFSYVSFHAPRFTYENNKETKILLEKIKKAHKHINFDTILFHPDDIKDWNMFKELDLPLAFENMDHRKDFGKNVEDLKICFNKINASFVYDAQHAFTNDKNGELAKELLDNFSKRLVHVHCSGYANDKDKSHVPLFYTKQKKVVKSIPSGFPIIIESSLFPEKGLIEQIKKEIKYITENMEK